MQQAVAEFAIGREEQKAGGVHIEAPYREKPGEAIGRHKACHTRTPVGVGHGGQISSRLIEHDGDRRIEQAHDYAVDLDHIAQRVHFAAELGYHFPVHAHATRGHKVFTSTTARSTRSREKLLQAHGNNGLAVRAKLGGLRIAHR